MINTLHYLNSIQAHVLVGLAILFFFLAKAIPALSNRSPVALFYAVLAGAFVLEGMGQGSEVIFFDMVNVDSFSRMLNQVILVVTALTIFMMGYSNEMDRKNDWEVFGILLTLVLGMMFMTSSVNLLMAVIAIELVSLPSYLLVALNRKEHASKEASLKYVLFGSFATGIMLYGMSLLFGLTGTLRIDLLWKGLNDISIVGSPVYLLAILMMLGGIAFKIAAVPFHFWCPDAYQAAPTPVTFFLSVAPKIAGLALLIRVLSYHAAIQTDSLKEIVSIIAMLTMTVGNFAALRQTNLKRLMAYSSISHAGFFLIGVAALTEVGRQAVYLNIPIYLLMNLGAFMALILMAGDKNFNLSSYKGLIRTKPVLVVTFGVFVFSLVGIPPFAGFIGKLYLFKAALEEGMMLLIVVGAINSVVALYYYVNILKVMVIDEPDENTVQFEDKKLPQLLLWACAVPLVFFGLYWQPILDWTSFIHLYR